MINVICVKQGTKYSADYVNRLYKMVDRNIRWTGNGSITFGNPFNFYCYTDDPKGLNAPIIPIKIESGLEKWWPKIDCLGMFNNEHDINILFDLDVIILNPLQRLMAVKTRTVSVLYAQWKEGYVAPRAREKFPTLYNSSIMKWEGNQGKEIYDYFQKHKDMILFKYAGVDRYLFNEPVEVDLLPTSIAYSYWKGVRYLKDTTPEKERTDYEVCILNHGEKENLAEWTTKYL